MRHVSLEPCDTVGREGGRKRGKEGGKEGKKDIQDNLTHAKKHLKRSSILFLFFMSSTPPKA